MDADDDGQWAARGKSAKEDIEGRSEDREYSRYLYSGGAYTSLSKKLKFVRYDWIESLTVWEKITTSIRPFDMQLDLRLCSMRQLQIAY